MDLNPTESMDVCLMFIVCCVGSSFCDEMITYSVESYQVCVCVCVWLCVIYKIAKLGSLGPIWVLVPQKKEKNYAL